ncbi:hypothetical protein VFPBJ_04023 [Purpureocillium lilacinum]|uniref:Uncharacterized protein n=1 Tax=Purpureocillium lilacinum TaxID=33203 RepID=A0A179GWB9_PURLI|nr:hypothetical protein VFPBJ_04023 [Purpureocillium lilacinum]
MVPKVPCPLLVLTFTCRATRPPCIHVLAGQYPYILILQPTYPHPHPPAPARRYVIGAVAATAATAALLRCEPETNVAAGAFGAALPSTLQPTRKFARLHSPNPSANRGSSAVLYEFSYILGRLWYLELEFRRSCP